MQPNYQDLLDKYNEAEHKRREQLTKIQKLQLRVFKLENDLKNEKEKF